MEFKQTKLSNGLQIVAEINKSAASFALGFFTKTGSRDETPEISGVSHFLEHMVFKGTSTRSALMVNQESDQMGALINAFTSEENTVYYASVLPEFQAKCTDLLCDIMRPSLRQEDFDIEKGVICEEIAMYEDEPHFRLYDNMMQTHFSNHNLSNSILGTPDSIMNLKRDQMQAYFDRRYSPTNITVAAVGNFDYDKLIAELEEKCSHWKAYETKREYKKPSDQVSTKIITDPKLARQNLGFISNAPACQDDQQYAAQLLATILGDSSSSRFYYSLVENALADEASMSFSPMGQAGAFLTFISCVPSKTTKVQEIVKTQIAEFLQAGPTEQEISAAKNKLASHATIRGEMPMSRLTPVGLEWVYTGKYTPLADQIKKLFAVTKSDILQIANQFRIDKFTTVALGPAEKI